jgi:hypothetical protein
MCSKRPNDEFLYENSKGLFSFDVVSNPSAGITPLYLVVTGKSPREEDIVCTSTFSMGVNGVVKYLEGSVILFTNPDCKPKQRFAKLPSPLSWINFQ